MTKVNGMSVREFLEETYRPRSEQRNDLVLLQEHNRVLRERRTKEERQLKIFVCVGLTLVITVLFGLNLMQNANLTDEQRETIERIFH